MRKISWIIMIFICFFKNSYCKNIFFKYFKKKGFEIFKSDILSGETCGDWTPSNDCKSKCGKIELCGGYECFGKNDYVV